MLVVGLTGSVGMGKSTTAGMFAAAGIPVHDADAAVHRLYAGPAVGPVEAAFPGVSEHGRIVRERLATRVLSDPAALGRLEAIVHPLVREAEAAFIQERRAAGHRVVLLDIPLLFEAGRAGDMDVVVVVSASAEVQRARVLARPGMTEAKFAALLARQLPDAEKRRRAHVAIDTGHGLETARQQVEALVRALAAAA